MKVSQISIGRFHHFHLARQLEKRGLLDSIWTGYPMAKLRDENGIPVSKIKTFPWVHTPYMVRSKLGLSNNNWLNKEWEWLAQQTLDKYVASQIVNPSILIALSGSGLNAGRRMHEIGGKYICDRGSSHIRFQNEILHDEYSRNELKFIGIDKRIIDKEEKEYQESDLITVPSEFVKSSFIKMGVSKEKIRKVPYGARLDRFSKIDSPKIDSFRVLWVGSVSIRKGFIYALEAFERFKHPNKEFIVIGNIEPDLQSIIKNRVLDKVVFKGLCPNQELPYWYSSSHVFVLPSLEEGLAMVQGEALACGCPVIASFNTGATDLFTDTKEGFIVPIRDSMLILEHFHTLADDEGLRSEMSQSAIEKVQALRGWDRYGDDILNIIQSLA